MRQNRDSQDRGDDDYVSPFDTEEEFWGTFHLFNELNHPLSWQVTRANKSHIDEFGNRIKDGEAYFSRTLGGSFTNIRRLSRRSMEAMLGLVMRRTCRELTDLCLLLKGKREEVERQEFANISKALERQLPPIGRTAEDLPGGQATAPSFQQMIEEMSPGERWCAVVAGADETPEAVVGWFDSWEAADSYVTGLVEMSDTQEVRFWIKKGYQAQSWQP